MENTTKVPGIEFTAPHPTEVTGHASNHTILRGADSILSQPDKKASCEHVKFFKDMDGQSKFLRFEVKSSQGGLLRFTLCYNEAGLPEVEDQSILLVVDQQTKAIAAGKALELKPGRPHPVRLRINNASSHHVDKLFVVRFHLEGTGSALRSDPILVLSRPPKQNKLSMAYARLARHFGPWLPAAPGIVECPACGAHHQSALAPSQRTHNKRCALEAAIKRQSEADKKEAAEAATVRGDAIGGDGSADAMEAPAAQTFTQMLAAAAPVPPTALAAAVAARGGGAAAAATAQMQAAGSFTCSDGSGMAMLLKQRDMLSCSEPDTSRTGDKWLQWKQALDEVTEQIEAHELTLTESTAAMSISDGGTSAPASSRTHSRTPNKSPRHKKQRAALGLLATDIEAAASVGNLSSPVAAVSGSGAAPQSPGLFGSCELFGENDNLPPTPSTAELLATFMRSSSDE